MAYRVEIASNAEVELEQLYMWVVERAPQQGVAWFNRLERAILCSTNIRSVAQSRRRALTRIIRFGC